MDQIGIKKLGFFFLIIVLIFLSVSCSSKRSPTVDNDALEKEDILDQDEKEPLYEPLVKEEKDLAGAFMVSIGNNSGARPQSGLDKADRVYEIIAEGGITRYLAVFHSQEAEKIGPVRSSRYYFTYIVKGHDLPFAHAGGSTQALSLIQKLKLKDLDEIYNAGGYFYRSKDRRAPDNLYTSTDLLAKGARAKKHSLLPLEPLNQGLLEDGEKIDKIEIAYNKTYKVAYIWDGEQYQRFINGQAQKTLEGQEIYTENIIILAAKTRDVVTDQLRSEVDLIDRGRAIFFTGGMAYDGFWEKDAAASEFEYIYQDQPMKFLGEHAWINVVGSFNQVEQSLITQ